MKAPRLNLVDVTRQAVAVAVTFHVIAIHVYILQVITRLTAR